MQGRTATFSTFSNGHFDEAAFEEQITAGRMPMMICWYWILKLKARFLSGDYAEALAAADKAKPLLEASAGRADGIGALLDSVDRSPGGVAQTPYGAPGTLARVGRKLSADVRRQAHAGVGRDVGGTLAQTYFENGRLQEALDAINAAIRANTNIPNELYLAPANLALKAKILDKMGDSTAAGGFFGQSTTLVDAMIQKASTVSMQRHR